MAGSKVFATVRKAVVRFGIADNSDQLAAFVSRELEADFTFQPTELPVNAALQRDLEAALTEILSAGEEESEVISVGEKAARLAASLLGRLDDKWAFETKLSWYLHQVED